MYNLAFNYVLGKSILLVENRNRRVIKANVKDNIIPHN